MDALSARLPGPVDTAMAHASRVAATRPTTAPPPNAREGSVLPVGQIQPDETGDTVVFPAGPLAERISGVSLEVNGGRPARSLG